MFVTGASGPTMHHPLTNLGTNMSCDRKNFAGWPCDERAEELRQAFLDADEADKPTALDRFATARCGPWEAQKPGCFRPDQATSRTTGFFQNGPAQDPPTAAIGRRTCMSTA